MQIGDFCADLNFETHLNFVSRRKPQKKKLPMDKNEVERSTKQSILLDGGYAIPLPFEADTKTSNFTHQRVSHH